MIKIAICEDEKEQQDLLKTHINQIFKDLPINYSLYTFNSGEELLKNYPKNIDIFLIDIQLNEINGMILQEKSEKQTTKQK